MIIFCKELNQFHLSRIYNMDESGFVFRMLPNLTYLAPEENIKDVHGTKAMLANSRLTFAASINPTGSQVTSVLYW